MYEYPTSINLTSSSGFGNIIDYTNTVTNHWFSNMILIAIYILVLMGYYKAKDDFGGALAIAGFGTFIVGLFFWLGGLLSGYVFSVVIAMMLIGVVIILVDNQ